MLSSGPELNLPFKAAEAALSFLGQAHSIEGWRGNLLSRLTQQYRAGATRVTPAQALAAENAFESFGNDYQTAHRQRINPRH